jgi:hypothetical protein
MTMTVGEAVAAGVAAGGGINLPSGIKIEPGRETSQVNGQGQVIQGIVFPITTPAGTTSSVFLPYTQIDNDPGSVGATIAARAASIQAIAG